MNELLWLLLPVAAASGYLAARRFYLSQSDHPSDDRLTPDYFRGLGYVIDDRPDKAIEVFTDMLEVNPDTIETHLALGGIYRRRGEVDRAIHVHQNLVARKTLSLAQRTHALLELAHDYLSAGLFDRAEGLYREVIESGQEVDSARYGLLKIYEQQKDWDQAIDVATGLKSDDSQAMSSVIAQYYCELADEARRSNELAALDTDINQALLHDPDCIRARLMQGNLQRESAAYRSAIETYAKIGSSAPEFLVEIVDLVLECFRKLDDLDGARRWIGERLPQAHEPNLLLAEVDLIAQLDGEQQAADALAEFLMRWPSVSGLERLMSLRLTHLEQEPVHYQELRRIVTRIQERSPSYRCNHCGFSGRTLHWNCPSCKHWGSVKPLLTLEDEKL